MTALLAWTDYKERTLDGTLTLTAGVHVILLKTLTMSNGHAINLRLFTLTLAAALQPTKYDIIVKIGTVYKRPLAYGLRPRIDNPGLR